MTISAQQRTGFHSVLSASGRSQEIPESADVYGWLVGSWKLDVYDYQPDGTVRRSNGEVHFARVLEGFGGGDRPALFQSRDANARSRKFELSPVTLQWHRWPAQ